jgi:SAM-dependent methyltransferase
VFDAVVVQGALHRTLQIAEAVDEVLRVLRAEGFIYVEEPFMEPVQDGPYDFFRFSHLGLRGLFLGCEELDSGVVNGVGTALASSWRHFLWSLPRSRRAGFLLATVGSFTSFFWKYLDKRLEKRPRAVDAAASVFFFGRRGASPLSVAELVAGYRGAAAWSERQPGAARSASEVFTEWAATDRDITMQNNHAAAVDEMLAAAIAALGNAEGYTAIDAGCGNGWIVRRLSSSIGCLSATGVDGSAGMIAKARALDPLGRYVIADLSTWLPPERVDLVVSMEVLYYLDDPVALLRRIATTWLKPGGYAVFGIDHYQENELSLRWPTGIGVRMTTWPEARWLSALEEAGFTRVRTWRAAAHPGEAGTLAMLVKAPGSGTNSSR